MMDVEESKDYRSKLITLVYKNTVLWDKTKKVRLSYAEKNRIWSSIGKELGKTGELARKNWQCLRDQYRRDVKKQEVDGIESSWAFFDEISFIRKVLRPRKFKICQDVDESRNMKEGRRAKKIKTRRSCSKVIPTTDNFMTHIFDTANDHSNAVCKDQQGQQQGTTISDLPTREHLEVCLHKPIKMEMDNESVETIIHNVSTEPPKEAANEILVQRAQIPKDQSYNLYARTVTRMRRKRRAVKNHKRARYSTRSKSNSNISEGSTQSLIPKISNIEENVGAINDVRLEQTHSQLGNEAASISKDQPQQIPPLSKTPSSTEIPEIEIKEEVEILVVEDKSKSKEIEKPTDKEDDDYHFVISLLPTLRRIAHDRKLKTRMEIMRAVMEAAQSDNT